MVDRPPDVRLRCAGMVLTAVLLVTPAVGAGCAAGCDQAGQAAGCHPPASVDVLVADCCCAAGELASASRGAVALSPSPAVALSVAAAVVSTGTARPTTADRTVTQARSHDRAADPTSLYVLHASFLI